MGNAVLTRACNKACAFCFSPNDGSAPMDRARFDSLADRLVAEGRDVLPLVGGEPTLHPEFIPIIERALSRRLRIRLFTHGRIVGEVLERLAGLPVGACTSIVNASASLGKDGTLDPVVRAALARLGPRACLGITIDDEGRPYRRLLRFYDEFGLLRRLRIGLAQPTLEGDNRHHPDYRRPGLGRAIAEIAIRASVHHVGLEFDCGFVLCTFSKAQRKAMDRLGVPYRSVCGAIPDIAPNGDAWPCFPLSLAYHTNVDDHGSLDAVRGHFERRLRGFRAAGLYDDCPRCEHFHDGSCTGGCLARVIPTFRSPRRDHPRDGGCRGPLEPPSVRALGRPFFEGSS